MAADTLLLLFDSSEPDRAHLTVLDGGPAMLAITASEDGELSHVLLGRPEVERLRDGLTAWLDQLAAELAEIKAAADADRSARQRDRCGELPDPSRPGRLLVLAHASGGDDAV
tara:strand:- start:226 stop:564 length:339 start_codon:yes stop_codon:yes gene_type:complete